MCDTYDISYSTKIMFRCAHDNSAVPKLIDDGTETCQMIIDFPTPIMCPKVTEIECDFYSTALKAGFDLNPLSGATHNFIVNHWTDTGESVRYVLNLCRNLLHQKDVTCDPDAAACKIEKDSDHKLKYTNLGGIIPSSTPTAVKTCDDCTEYKVIVEYGNGEACKNDASSKRKTTIELHCDESQVSSSPEFVSDDDCETKFVWMSKYACEIGKQDLREDCTAVNPSTEHTFDLNKIFTKENDQLTVPVDGVQYNLGICKQHPSCPDGMGACSAKGDTKNALGKANKRVLYSHGALQLTYTEGDVCNKKTQLKYATMIQFLCDGKSSEPVASLVAQTNGGCNKQFVVRTAHACELQAECAAQRNSDMMYMDLTPLRPQHGHEIVGDVPEKNGTMYLNLCNPLEPIKGIPCPPGTIVCMLPPGKSPISIADFDPTVEWQWQDGGSPTITYNSTTPCTPKKHYSTKIILTCEERISRGYPTFVGLDDCTYLINWPTTLTCATTAVPEEPDMPKLNDCILEDDAKGYYFDFKLNTENTFSTNTNDYKFDICSGVQGTPGCENSAICRKSKSASDGWQSLGRLDKMKIFNKLELASSIGLEMKFSDGIPCPDEIGKNFSTVIWFSCNMRDEETKPVVVSSGLDIFRTINC